MKLRKELKKTQGLLDVATEAAEENKIQLRNLGQRLNAALARVATEERKRRSLEQAERKRSEQERNNFFANTDEARKEIDNLKAVNSVLAATIETLSALEKDDSAEFKALQNKLDEVSKHNNNLQLQIDASKLENEKLLRENKNVKAFSDDLNRRLSVIQSELNTIALFNDALNIMTKSSVQQDQSNFDSMPLHITSVSSDNLTGFTEDDGSNCYLGVKLIGSDDKVIEIGFENNVIPLYLMTNNDTNQMHLSDFGEVEKKNIQWQNKRLMLVDTRPEGSGSQSCEIISERIMPIVVEARLTPSKEPTAVVARDGSLKLNNLPLVKRKDQ